MSRPSLVLATVLATTLASPLGARAFSDHADFAADPIEGGGGGRYFTGSIADGYTCAVCHRGGPPPEGVEISGIPEDGFTPGQQYFFTIDLVDERAAVFEIVTPTGTPAGTLTATPTDCPSTDPPVPAIWTADATGGRTVAGLDVCPTFTELDVEWTAPADQNPVWLNLVVVDVGEDYTGEPAGDGVYVYSFLLPAVGDGAESARVGGVCAITPGAGPAFPSALLLLALGALARRRR